MKDTQLDMIKHEAKYGNAQRARIGAATLKAFTDASTSSGDDETDLSDLIANLWHYADARGFEMLDILKRGQDHWERETMDGAPADASALESQS